MSRRIRLVEEADLPAVAELLRTAFADRSTPPADIDALRWKYLRTGPLWDGARAFVVEHEGAIVAHAGFTPAVFISPKNDPVTSLTVTDWAADPQIPGVGIVLYAHLARYAESAFLVGGAAVTREIVPKLGFRPFAEGKIYARWIRPWREFWRREKSIRAFQRLAHGVLHQLHGRPLRHGAWVATPVDRFDSEVEPVIATRPTRRTICQRTQASLNYMLECPIVRMQGCLLRDASAVRGYAIMAYRAWEARVVDISIDSERPEDWVSAYGAATTLARRDPRVCRVRAMVAAADQEQALVRNGFWVNQHESFLLFDPKKRAPELPIDLQFFESDLAFV